jgi:hypothetical protein
MKLTWNLGSRVGNQWVDILLFLIWDCIYSGDVRMLGKGVGSGIGGEFWGVVWCWIKRGGAVTKEEFFIWIEDPLIWGFPESWLPITFSFFVLIAYFLSFLSKYRSLELGSGISKVVWCSKRLKTYGDFVFWDNAGNIRNGISWKKGLYTDLLSGKVSTSM